MLITQHIYINKSCDSYQQDILTKYKNAANYPQIYLFIAGRYS